MPKRLESLSAAAEIANVHPRTLRRYIASGRLTAYRVGPRLLKVSLDDLEALLVPVGGGAV
ncbi:helix-turn-helix domain-containing protein [Mycobacterium kyorinense]|uniref:helix-turn-helix domain-containing protein n=1 Tax=Mycobacterium kyorinense TaxID=487514 RepID=UPI0005ED4D61|nr:helix-turn-helix domain-containing protein [Mycobacterium kyorinense]